MRNIVLLLLAGCLGMGPAFAIEKATSNPYATIAARNPFHLLPVVKPDLVPVVPQVMGLIRLSGISSVGARRLALVEVQESTGSPVLRAVLAENEQFAGIRLLTIDEQQGTAFMDTMGTQMKVAVSRSFERLGNGASIIPVDYRR